MSNGKRESAKLEVANKRATALELRLQGMTYRQIGDAMGIADSSAHDLVTAALREIPAPGVELLRREQGETLRLMLRHLWPRIERGEPRAIEVGVRILERQAKLLGLDAPAVKQVEVITKEAIEAAILDLEREIAELEE
ncbi:hypothetical protein [Ferrimicrobium sp.]|uniref:hypothetical protein n=1 Tax=Ferrimicrobium sp. TaxID=2926050 RepID=UPI002633C027|nr:hypothetical protein [Ferrimicrobium sp.]